ncbi:addiction module toxin, HicA family [Candidatus Micrarchaeota archaeon]|nr:addiction module toxin, HicA family [Candidatus Micrarchaeota archaeon]
MKLAPVSPQKLVKMLGFLGYFPARQKGSHLILEDSGTGKIVVIPVHSSKDISVGLLSSILRETGISRKKYFELLGKA